MRKFSSRKILALFFATLMLLGFAAPARAVPFSNGDVFAGLQPGHVGHFSSTGTFLQTLNMSSGTGEVTGMAFNSTGFLYATNFGPQQISVFDSNGNLVGTFGSGFNCDPESIVFNKTGFVYVGQADCTHQIMLFSPTGIFIKSFSPTVGPRGTDWIDLDPNQCTMYYTSEGNSVRRFNVCTNTQMADLATGLPTGTMYAHRLLPDGTTLVAASGNVVRLNSTGSIIKTYTVAGETSFFFALNLDPDGTSFWTAGFFSHNVYKINIATGNVLVNFGAHLPKGADSVSLAGLVIKGDLTGGTGFINPVIPEVPLGTILTALIPIAALIVYTKRQALHFK
jgi:DNA-binding beta-propeller fold protein YncE